MFNIPSKPEPEYSVQNEDGSWTEYYTPENYRKYVEYHKAKSDYAKKLGMFGLAAGFIIGRLMA